MKVKAFGNRFMKLTTSIVEDTFVYVGNNCTEVKSIYMYCSIYNINDQIVGTHEVNDASSEKYNVDDDSMFDFLDKGVESVEMIANLFQEDEREVPTLMKVTYHPKTNTFDNG